jgi:hypothetical protein
MLDSMASKGAEGHDAVRIRRPRPRRDALRGALVLEGDAAARHAAACLGRLAAEMYTRGLIPEFTTLVHDDEALKEAA